MVLAGNATDLLAEKDLFLILLLFVLTIMVSYIWTKLRTAHNPFLTPPSIYSDLHSKVEQGKDLLKVGFKRQRVPDNLDAIIIGSGMGGLTCAALMARAGKKVLVLEQHDRVGGSTHTFTQKGFEFDVGVHYVGEMNLGSMNRTLMDILTDEQLCWDKMDKEYDRLVLRQDRGDKTKHFSRVTGKEENIKRLLQYFPEEEKAILEFSNRVEQSHKALVGYAVMKQLPKWLLAVLVKTGIYDLLFAGYSDVAGKTVGSVLDQLTQNEELKFVLGYAFGDYGTFPSEAPFLMHGTLMKHFQEGAYYPRGGSSELASKMLPGILRSGGAVLVRAPVDRILTDPAGIVSGVSVLRNGTNHEINAPVVISSAGLYNTYARLLPRKVADKYDVASVCEKVDKGMSCFQTFIGLRGSAEELGLKRRNYWVYNSIDVARDMKAFWSLPREDVVDADVPLIFISFPSAKDSTWEHRHSDRVSVCVAVTFVNWSWFEEWESSADLRRSPVYEGFKNALQNNIWKAVLDVFPQLEHRLEHIDSGTPLSHKYYLNSPRGDIYGIDHTLRRFEPDLAIQLRPETPIPGLFLTGQDVFTCGVMGATVSGLITSGAVLGRNHFIDLFIVMGKRNVAVFIKLLMKKIFG